MQQELGLEHAQPHVTPLCTAEPPKQDPAEHPVTLATKAPSVSLPQDPPEERVKVPALTWMGEISATYWIPADWAV